MVAGGVVDDGEPVEREWATVDDDAPADGARGLLARPHIPAAVRVDGLHAAALVDDEIDRDTTIAHADRPLWPKRTSAGPAKRVRSCSVPWRRSQTAHHELRAGPIAAVAAHSMSSSENAAT